MCSHEISECPECGSTNLEPIGRQEDELVCSDCGLVIELDETKEPQDSPEEVAASDTSDSHFSDKSKPTDSADDTECQGSDVPSDADKGLTTSVDWKDNRERSDIEIETTHDVHKEVHLKYFAELEDGQLKIADEPMGERQAGYRVNEYDYGEYFFCTCGERFWDKESAKEHLINTEDR